MNPFRDDSRRRELMAYLDTNAIHRRNPVFV